MNKKYFTSISYLVSSTTNCSLLMERELTPGVSRNSSTTLTYLNEILKQEKTDIYGIVNKTDMAIK